MKKVPVEILKEYYHYNSDNGEFIWIKLPSPAGDARLGKVAGWVDGKGYWTISILGEKYLAHRLAWLYCYGDYPSKIDHINGNSRDNRIVNLRNCTQQQNMRNMRKRITNTSGYKGVSFNTATNSWRASIRVSGRTLYLGLYNNLIDAAKAYDAAAIKYFEEFAAPNFREVA